MTTEEGVAMKAKSILWLVVIATACVGLVIGAGGSVQTESITVDDPRPLAEAVKHFQGRYGWIVTFEDPRHEMKDVIDVTDAVRNPAAAPTQHRVFGPRGGPFTATFQNPAPDSSPAEVAEVLDVIVAAYNQTGYPGSFRVIRTDEVFHVLPQSSILETRVSLLPQAGRNTFDALRSVLGAISSTTGQQVVLGTSPFNLLVQTKMEEGATAETARNLLVRILQGTGKSLSWRLLYSLDLQKYALNIQIVDNRKSAQVS
jgi:hypothetical protein